MDNYIGEIRVFAGSYAPEGWAICRGQLMPISENDALYALIGTTYGGDGQQTFALPNIQSRVVVGQSPTYPIGMAAGVESVTLTSLQMPVHQHPITNSSVAAVTGGTAQKTPVQSYFGDRGGRSYVAAASGISLNAGAITGQSTVAGGSQPHNNIQPVLAVNYIIALQGIFPSFD